MNEFEDDVEHQYFNYQVKDGNNVIHLTVTEAEAEAYAIKYSYGAHQYKVEEIPTLA